MFEFVSVSNEAFADVVCKNNKDEWNNSALKKERDKNDDTHSLLAPLQINKDEWKNPLSEQAK